jgi:hypothetical protein
MWPRVGTVRLAQASRAWAKLEDWDGREHESGAERLNRPEAVAEDGEAEWSGERGFDARDNARSRRTQPSHAGEECADAEHGRDQSRGSHQEHAVHAPARGELAVGERVRAEHDRGRGAE